MKLYLKTLPKRLVLTLQAIILTPIFMTYIIMSDRSSVLEKESWSIFK